MRPNQHWDSGCSRPIHAYGPEVSAWVVRVVARGAVGCRGLATIRPASDVLVGGTSAQLCWPCGEEAVSDRPPRPAGCFHATVRRGRARWYHVRCGTPTVGRGGMLGRRHSAMTLTLIRDASRIFGTHLHCSVLASESLPCGGEGTPRAVIDGLVRRGPVSAHGLSQVACCGAPEPARQSGLDDARVGIKSVIKIALSVGEVSADNTSSSSKTRSFPRRLPQHVANQQGRWSVFPPIHQCCARWAGSRLLLPALSCPATEVKLGLENMVALDAALGAPSRAFRTVHVAGTNGKGSVSWKVARALSASGHSTGLFVSPHIACFRERVQIDGRLISEAEVERLLPHVLDVARREGIPATFFELVTQLAFCFYADQGAEYVSLETGLGGRLDSTNIVTPTASVITSIGLDHTRVLGCSIAGIAMEKAGIIKPNVPVVVGPSATPHIMAGVAAERGSPLHLVAAQPGFAADFDAENTAVARKAVELVLAQRERDGASPVRGGPGAGAQPVPALCDAAEAGLRSCPPSRFEVVRCGVTDGAGKGRKVSVLLDGAHNPQAFRRLVARLRASFPHVPIRFVVGMSNDKPATGSLSELATRAGVPSERMHVVQSVHYRAAPAPTLAEQLRPVGGPPIPETQIHAAGVFGEAVTRGIHQAVAAANDATLDTAGKLPEVVPLVTSSTSDDYDLGAALSDLRADGESGPGELVVVCGSVYLMLEARLALGFDEPRDDAEAQPQGENRQ